MKDHKGKIPSVRIMYEAGMKRSEKIILADAVRATIVRIEGFAGNRGLTDDHFTGSGRLFIKFSGIFKRSRFLKEIERRLPEYLFEKLSIEKVRMVPKLKLKVRPRTKVIHLFSAAR